MTTPNSSTFKLKWIKKKTNMDILITIILAICVGALVATFFSFVWVCVAFVAKAIVHEPATANLDKHIIWMGILAGIIFLLLN